MMASTFSLTPLTMRPKSDAGSTAEATAVVAAPSWTSSTTMSAPAAFSSSASRLAATTGASIVRPAMPAGDTSSGRWSVTAPTKPTRTSPKSWIQVSGSAGEPSALAHVGAEVLPHRAAERVRHRVVRRHHPLGEVGVALVELVVADGRDVEAGLVEQVDVGLSAAMNDSNVDAPMRSPAAPNTVFGYCARSCSTAPEMSAPPSVAACASQVAVARAG